MKHEKHNRWLAACALAALAAPGTAAHAQSDVTVFGTVDLFMNRAKSGPTSVSRLEDGGHTASRIAFRGTEDLGGGLRAGFLLEAGVAPDTGLGTLPGPGVAFTRQSFVGLAGPWGAVDLGRMYTPMFYTLFRADPFGVNSLFSSLNLVAATDAQPRLRAFAARASNLVRYRAPADQPFIVDVAYSFGETPSPNGNNGNLYGATVGWNQKPFYIAYGFQKALDGSPTAPVAAPATTHYQALSAGWEVTPTVRVTGNYMVNRVNVAGTRDAKITQLGAEWSVTPAGKLLASAATRKVDGSGRGQRTFTLGYDHTLSKRTALYARWLQLDNRGGASATLANVPVVANSGDGVRSLAIGVRHNF